jgi:hypothetical protein
MVGVKVTVVGKANPIDMLVRNGDEDADNPKAGLNP